MQADPKRIADTRAWLLKAAKDLRSAQEERGLKTLVDRAVRGCHRGEGGHAMMEGVR